MIKSFEEQFKLLSHLALYQTGLGLARAITKAEKMGEDKALASLYNQYIRVVDKLTLLAPVQKPTSPLDAMLAQINGEEVELEKAERRQMNGKQVNGQNQRKYGRSLNV